MSRYQRNQNTVASKLDDEIVMIDIDLGKYFSLNPVASSIWDILEEPKSKVEICSALLNEYDVDQQTCQTKVEAFLKELIDMKLVIKQ